MRIRKVAMIAASASPLCVILGLCVLRYYASRAYWHEMSIATTHIYSSGRDIRRDDGPLPFPFDARLPELPPSSKRIFVCYGGRDLFILLAASFDRLEDAKEYAKALASADMDAFSDYQFERGQYSDIHEQGESILKLAENDLHKKMWDIQNVRHGKVFASSPKDENGNWRRWGTDVLIDVDRSRVYYHLWTM